MVDAFRFLPVPDVVVLPASGAVQPPPDGPPRPQAGEPPAPGGGGRRGAVHAQPGHLRLLVPAVQDASRGGGRSRVQEEEVEEGDRGGRPGRSRAGEGEGEGQEEEEDWIEMLQMILGISVLENTNAKNCLVYGTFYYVQYSRTQFCTSTFDSTRVGPLV